MPKPNTPEQKPCLEELKKDTAAEQAVKDILSAWVAEASQDDNLYKERAACQKKLLDEYGDALVEAHRQLLRVRHEKYLAFIRNWEMDTEQSNNIAKTPKSSVG